VLEPVSVPRPGNFQFENAATALAALETLAASGCPVNSESARRGIEHVRWPGRLETVAHRPEIVVDGACNPGAMTVVAEYIGSRSTRWNIAAVVAMCRDKEVVDVLSILGNAASRIVFTQVRNPRVMNAAELAAKAPQGVESFIEPNPADALKRAAGLAGEDGLVLVTGSLYLVGEVFRIYGIGEGEE
jgi:dihydrofolate synthase/folylpolyglutamate synthase